MPINAYWTASHFFRVNMPSSLWSVARDPITQVMEFRSAVLGSHSESPWIFGKIEHENGLKFGLSSYINILM